MAKASPSKTSSSIPRARNTGLALVRSRATRLGGYYPWYVPGSRPRKCVNEIGWDIGAEIQTCAYDCGYGCFEEEGESGSGGGGGGSDG
jgi:hypothetical protein